MSAVLLLATFTIVVLWSEDLPRRDQPAGPGLGIRFLAAALRVRTELGSVKAQ
jgi:hypothetical protein